MPRGHCNPSRSWNASSNPVKVLSLSVFMHLNFCTDLSRFKKSLCCLTPPPAQISIYFCERPEFNLPLQWKEHKITVRRFMDYRSSSISIDYYVWNIVFTQLHGLNYTILCCARVCNLTVLFGTKREQKSFGNKATTTTTKSN